MRSHCRGGGGGVRSGDIFGGRGIWAVVLSGMGVQVGWSVHCLTFLWCSLNFFLFISLVVCLYLLVQVGVSCGGSYRLLVSSVSYLSVSGDRVRSFLLVAVDAVFPSVFCLVVVFFWFILVVVYICTSL